MESKVKLFEIESWVFSDLQRPFLVPHLEHKSFLSIPEVACYLFAQLTYFRSVNCFAWITGDRCIFVNVKGYVVMSHQVFSDDMKKQALDVFLLKGGSNV